MRNKEDYLKFFNDIDNDELSLKVFTQEDINSFIISFYFCKYKKKKKNPLILYEDNPVSIIAEKQYHDEPKNILKTIEEIEAKIENEKKEKKN